MLRSAASPRAGTLALTLLSTLVGAASRIEELGREAIDAEAGPPLFASWPSEPGSEAADLEDRDLGPVAHILNLRQDQDTDELSASEPSDGGFDAENVVTLYRSSSRSKNAHHIQNELLPTITACSRTKTIHR